MPTQGKKFTSVEIKGQTLSRDKEPNECPVCHRKIVPEELAWSISGDDISGSPRLECVFKCPNHQCGHLFIASYCLGTREIYGKSGEFAKGLKLKRFKLVQLFPKRPASTGIATEVAELSSDFIDVFTQAYEADTQNLVQLAGIGYWKALECLLEDFFKTSISQATTNNEGKQLADWIKERIDTDRIRDYISETAILANTDVVVRKKWTNQQVNELKILIRVIENWIVNAILTSKN